MGSPTEPEQEPEIDYENNSLENTLSQSLNLSSATSADEIRKRFRNTSRQPGESCDVFKNRVLQNCLQWYEAEGIHNHFENLHDLILREQLYNGCGKELRQYLQDKRVRSSREFVEFADEFLDVKRRNTEQRTGSKENLKMSSRSTRSMTVEDVDSINTMPRALRVMRDLQVPMTDKDMNLDKAKAIIKEALVAGDTSRRGKRVANIADRDTTTAALKDDANNRDKLRALYTEAYEYVSKLPRPFQTDLEQMFPHYDRQLKNYQEDLQSSQCVLLVAGEMGSGKSSLVNLLLGSPLLPTSELRCTATIVEISYGPTPQAVAHFRDDSMGHGKKPLVIRCDSSQRVGNFLKDLEMLIIKRDEETDESPFEKIQFYWPLDILQGGVTIVDSPGVGDAKGLPQILADYMEKAFGFIYVIDSTTSIHKHRLGQLLLKAVEASDGFDHNTALFVCNRWDQIQASDSERVKESLADRLSMILPGVKKSQLYPISVKQSTLDMEYGQVRPEHQQLVEGIRRFLPQTMRGKLRIYYRYLSILLKRSLYSLRISYNMLKDKVQEIRKNYKGVENRISVLQGNAKKKLDEMRHEVKRASFDAGSQAMEYMASMHNRSKLVEWTDAECPKREKTWQNVFKNANLAIGERVAHQINTWESRTEFVKTVEDGIIKSFKEQFDFFDDQLREIQGVLISGDEMRNFVMETRRDAPQKRPVKAQRPKGSSDSYLSLGAAVTANFALDPKDQRIKRLFKDKYDGSPAKVMKEATLMLLTQMTEATVASAMGKFFDRFIKGIDRVGSLVPQLMKADQDLLVNLNTELRNGQQKLDAFPSMSRTCSSLQGRLDMFYVQRLMVTDFTADQLVYGPVLGKGSFASVFKATLRLKAGDVQVAIKEPHDALKGEDVTDVLLEDAMLRDVEHKNIVKYYGVCRKGPEDNLRLIFTMEYCPYTLKGKCIDVDNSPSSLGNNPLRQREAIQHMANYLIQICEGLNYLHQKAVVHRDLKPENVLLSARSEVKIADFGLAKKVSEVVTHGIGTPVYMSPEILLFSDKYDTKADVYSLAMIMWELWYGKDLAKYASTEIVGGLKMSIEREWRPTLSIVHSPPPFWVELMTRCWAQKPKLRPSAREVGNALVNFLQEIQ